MHHDVELSAALWRVSDGEAAMDDALRVIAAQTGGARIVACPARSDAERTALRGRANVRPEIAARLWRGFADEAANPFLPALARAAPGRLHHHRGLIPWDAIASSAFFAQVWRPAGIGREAAAMRLPVTGRGDLTVYLGLPEGRPWLSARAVERAEAALRALGRAAARLPQPVGAARGPGAAARWCARTLGATYGLTPREAQAALGLLAGRTPDRIAVHCGIKAASVRMYLKRVYEKTMTAGQVDLIATLAGTVEREA